MVGCGRFAICPYVVATKCKLLARLFRGGGSISLSSSTPQNGSRSTDPDQVPTATSFSTVGTPSLAPSNAPLPPGIPARIIPGAGGVNPEAGDLNGFTLIAILFDRGFNWDTVVHNPSSPGQIFSWPPALISTALSITGTRSSRLRHWPHSFPAIQRPQRVIISLVMMPYLRATAAWFNSPTPAQSVVGVTLLALILYTGYNIPEPSMVHALSWITYINVRISCRVHSL